MYEMKNERKTWKEVFHTDGSQKESGGGYICIIQSNFKLSTLIRGKEENVMIAKGSIHEKSIIIINNTLTSECPNM
jgi:hypothetical protein